MSTTGLALSNPSRTIVVTLHDDGFVCYLFASDVPFGQLPFLEVDGVKIGQSYTIARYLARKFGKFKTLFTESSYALLPTESLRLTKNDLYY